MNNLAKTAMLVSVQIVNGGLLGERKDTTATQMVEDTYNIAHRRAKASKYLIDRKHKAVKGVVAASQRVREVVYRYTVPWGDEKMRLLPVKVYDEFKEKLDVAMAELMAAREDYLHVYPALISASERDLGGLFDAGQYPSITKARSLFSDKVQYWPFPESNNFIADISKAAAQAAKDAMDAEVDARLTEATRDLVRRAREDVESFVEKLTQYKRDANGNLFGVFRDTLVTNLEDTANLIYRMNITGNNDINEIVRQLRTLTKFTANELRDSEFIRGDQIRDGSKLLEKLKYMETADKDIADLVAGASDYMD